jgi:hypothetical protein
MKIVFALTAIAVAAGILAGCSCCPSPCNPCEPCCPEPVYRSPCCPAPSGDVTGAWGAAAPAAPAPAPGGCGAACGGGK